MNRADKAIELFTYYFQTAFDAAGLSWGCDNDTEIEIAVQNIVEAATPEPEPATEQLLQRHRDAAALRIDEIHELKFAAIEQKEVIRQYRAAQNAHLDRAEKAEKEIAELRGECSLLRELLHEVIPFSPSDTHLKRAQLLGIRKV